MPVADGAVIKGTNPDELHADLAIVLMLAMVGANEARKDGREDVAGAALDSILRVTENLLEPIRNTTEVEYRERPGF